MVEEIITFGTNKRQHFRFWKAVHETDDSITYMLYSMRTAWMNYYAAQEALKNDFLVLTDEERARVIPNKAGDLLWFLSVKQLGFVPMDINDRNWGLNSIIEDLVPKEVWEDDETFQYFSDPDTAVDHRREFGDSYWISTPYIGNPNIVWVVDSCGSAGAYDGAYGSGGVRPCITLKKEES